MPFLRCPPPLAASGRWPLLLLLLLVAAAQSMSACRSTRFPDDPPDHPLWEELQEAPDEYYALVRTGVRSRVLGILPEDEMRRLLRDAKAAWPAIDAQETAGAIANVLRLRGLAPVADRVSATLAANAGSAPADSVNARLEAGAVKVGLLEAYEEAEHRE